jgi:muconate cycloisomerase
MADSLPIAALTIHRLAIPMRVRFHHAAAERSVADPIVVALELADGTVGYGETLPRPYVTGETDEDVIATIRDVFVPILVEVHPANFGQVIEAAASLPLFDRGGRVITAARAAVELALLDVYGRAFGRSLDTLAGWFDEPWLGRPGSRDTVRFSGVVSGADPRRACRTIRKMRLYGLRDFKLKVGDAGDRARVEACMSLLGGKIAAAKATLRLDANGAWSPDEAAARLRLWQTLPIACVEQPVSKSNPDGWVALAGRVSLPLMADESLVTPDDAERLAAVRGPVWFNIRISKNGGLMPAIQLAVIAHRHGVPYQLGCMVGETSILSAAGRWFLQLVPAVRFAEGSFGTFLLRDDVVAKPLRFRYGGRWTPQAGPGLGIEVKEDRLQRLSLTPPVRIPF